MRDSRGPLILYLRKAIATVGVLPKLFHLPTIVLTPLWFARRNNTFKTGMGFALHRAETLNMDPPNPEYTLTPHTIAPGTLIMFVHHVLLTPRNCRKAQHPYKLPKLTRKT